VKYQSGLDPEVSLMHGGVPAGHVRIIGTPPHLAQRMGGPLAGFRAADWRSLPVAAGTQKPLSVEF
jgi:hypothetical protein